MTNYEAISARLYPYDVDDNLIAVACMDAGLGQEDEYSAEAKKPVSKAAIDVLRQLVVLTSESNGGYSLGYDVDGLRRRIHALAKENGFADIAEEFNPQPTVTFR